MNVPGPRKNPSVSPPVSVQVHVQPLVTAQLPPRGQQAPPPSSAPASQANFGQRPGDSYEAYNTSFHLRGVRQHFPQPGSQQQQQQQRMLYSQPPQKNQLQGQQQSAGPPPSAPTSGNGLHHQGPPPPQPQQGGVPPSHPPPGTHYNATLGAHSNVVLSNQPLSSAHVPPPPGPTPPTDLNTLNMYSQTQQPRPANQQNFMPPRSNVPGNMNPRQPRGPMNNINVSQAGNMYGTMFTQGNPPPYLQSMQGHSQVITLTGPPASNVMYQPRMPGGIFAAQQSGYPATSMAPQYAHYNVPSQNNPIYYPPQQQQMPAQQHRPVSVSIQAQATPQQAQYPPRRERKMLTITDPNTGRNITEDLMQSGPNKSATPPVAETESPAATPTESAASPPPATQAANNEIAAQFAAQVAKALKPEDRLAAAAAAAAANAVTDGETMTPIETTEPNPEVAEPEPVAVGIPTPVAPSTTSTTASELAPVHAPAAEVSEETVAEASAQLTAPVAAAPSPVAAAPSPVAAAPAPVAPAPVAVEVVEEAVVESPVESQPPALQSDDLAAASASKKDKSRKQKLRELNNKPDHGSDMDAFVDTSLEDTPPAMTTSTTSSTSSCPPEPAVKKPAPEVVEESPAASAPPAEEVNHQEEKAPQEEPVVPPPTVVVEEVVAPPKKEEVVPDDDDVAQEEDEMEDEELEEDSSDKENDGKKGMELRYEYKEDQWSPLNLEGKKQYDRAFLLQLQFANESLEKPTNLPGLDVILDAPMRHNEQPRGDRGPPSMKQMIDFTPGFVKSSPSGSKGQMGPGGMRSRSRQKDQRPPGKVISIQRSEDVTLKRAKNAWKPPAKVASADGVSQELVEQEVFRKVRAILNKLTPQNFQTLIPQFAELEISTESLLKGAIMIVFEKAISEPAFSVTYANLCKRLGQVKVPSDKDPSQMVVFRNLLVVQCQIEFQKDKAAEVEDAAKLLSIEAAESEEEKKQLRLELEYARTMARRRSNGNIRFIGELYKLDVLLEKIMHECVHKLLKAKDEESMECLCGLLTTIGKKIDVKNGTKLFDQYFQRIETIVNNRQFSSRVRFMLQDVIDLRKNKWIPRREDKGPKMISEVHDEAEREKQEKAALLHSLPPQDKRSRGPGPNRGQQGGGPQQQSDDGWTSVSKRAPQMDPKRMNIRINKVEGDIQLGPGGRGGFSWARGSSGGSKPSSQEAEKSSAPANRFSALSGAEDARGRGSSATRSSMPPPANPKSAGRLSQGRDSRGRNITRASREHDREAAIAAARNINRPSSSNRSAPGSRNQSRESSRNRERSREPPTSEASRPAAVAQPAAKEFTDEEVERKTTYLVDELLLNNDLKEAVLSVKDIESPAKHDKIVYAILNHVLERSQKARSGGAKLLSELLTQGVVSIAKFTQGWVDILEFAEDLATDIPNVWAYFGELLAPSLVSGALPLDALQAICKPCMAFSKAHVLAAAALKATADIIGLEKVADMWRLAQMQWQDFTPSSCDLNEFLTQNKLEMLNATELTIGQIKSELLRIVQPKMTNDAILEWIAENVTEVQRKDSQFVRALMTAVCSSVIIDHEAKKQLNVPALKDRATLLQIYLDHDGNLELQALYALQALMVSMHHPSGLLRTFFDVLYDEDLISEDSFFKWDSSDDAAEAGKGVARHSVRQFFTWLHEPSEDQEDA